MKAKKKEEFVTSSFDSFKCLHQAINMMVLNPSLVKSKFQKKLKIYKEMKNFGSLECPCCHSKEYIRWGFYERGVVYIKEDKEYSETINIQRIRCRTYGRNLFHCALEDSCEKYHGIGYKKMPRTTKTFSITHTAHHLDPFFYLFHKFH